MYIKAFDHTNVAFSSKSAAQAHPSYIKPTLVALSILCIFGTVACYLQFGHQLFSHYPFQAAIPFTLGAVAVASVPFFVAALTHKKVAPPLEIEDENQDPNSLNFQKQTFSDTEEKLKTDELIDPIPSTDSSSQLLPKLSDEDTSATTGHSVWHTDGFRLQCPDYHTSGDSWSDADLQLFFKKGLLRHYLGTTFQQAGFDIVYNYENLETLYNLAYYDQKRKKELARFFKLNPQDLDSPSILHTVIARAKNLQKFIFSFLNSQKILLEMGADYQREKVQLEKAQNIQNYPMADLLALDRQLDRRQEFIFHWVKDFCAQLSLFTQKPDAQFEDFQYNPPEFIEWQTYYKLRRVTNHIPARTLSE